MSRYRKLMSEALNEVRALEVEDADYLKPRLNPQQIANIKKVFQKKNWWKTINTFWIFLKKKNLILLKENFTKIYMLLPLWEYHTKLGLKIIYDEQTK